MLGLTSDIPSEINLLRFNCPSSKDSYKEFPVLLIVDHSLLGIPASVSAWEVLVFNIKVCPSLSIYSTGNSLIDIFLVFIESTKSSIVLIGSQPTQNIFLCPFH